MLLDPEQKIARPRQIYTGAGPRTYIPRDRRQLMRVALALAVFLVLQGAAPPRFRFEPGVEHLRQLARDRRPAGRFGGHRAVEEVHQGQLAAAGVAVTEQAWDDQTPTGQVHMVNLMATIPGRQQRAARDRRPLRHQEVPRVQVRRRQRRRSSARSC